MGDKHGWHHGGIQDNFPDDALDLKKIYMSMQAGEENFFSSPDAFYHPEKSDLLKIPSDTRNILFMLSVTEHVVHSQHWQKLSLRRKYDLLGAGLYPLSCQKMMTWGRRTRGTGRIFGMGPDI